MNGRSKVHRGASIVFIFFLLGLGLGFAWALGFDEERRRRLLKTLSELKELPFRVFI